MIIVLWAYHEAGYRAVRKLHADGHDLVVFTLEAPPYIPSVAELTRTLGHTVYIAATNDCMKEVIGGIKPDLGLSMYYPRIIDEEVLALPRIGAFNFHPSLLPRHRGCFSAPWAIIEGDEETGITCHEMEAKVDTGGILCQSKIRIQPTDTAFSLYYKLVDLAVIQLDKVLHRLSRKQFTLLKQKGSGCYHPREIPYKGLIDPDWSIEMTDRFIRAMYFPPHEPARLEIDNDSYTITSIEEYREHFQRRLRT